MEPLVVHHHLVVQADGSERTRRLVQCPSRCQAIDVRACSQCHHGRGLVWDDRLERDVIDCSLAPLATTSVVPPAARRGVGQGDPLGEATVLEAMSRDVVCVTPECSVGRARRLLEQEGIGAVVVVDQHAAVLGLVSTTTLTLAHVEDERPTRDVMARPILVAGSLRLTRAAAIMAHLGAHHLVVTDSGARLAGILSTLDVLRHLGQASGSLVTRRPWRVATPGA